MADLGENFFQLTYFEVNFGTNISRSSRLNEYERIRVSKFPVFPNIRYCRISIFANSFIHEPLHFCIHLLSKILRPQVSLSLNFLYFHIIISE